MINKILEILTSNDSQAKELGCQLLIAEFNKTYNHPYHLIFKIRNIAEIITGCFKFEPPEELTIEELEKNGINYQYPFIFNFGNIAMTHTYIQFRQTSLHPKAVAKSPIKVCSTVKDFHYEGDTEFFKKLSSKLHSDISQYVSLMNITVASNYPGNSNYVGDSIVIYNLISNCIKFYKNYDFLHLLIEWEIVNELIPHYGEELKLHWYELRLKETPSILFYEFGEEEYREEVEKLEKRNGEKV